MSKKIELKKGDKAPEISLNNKDGKLQSLKDFEGKWVVLYFYPKDNTPGCTTEAKDFSEMTKDFDKENSVIIGVSPDSEKSHEKFITKHDLKVILLSDPEKVTCQDYGVWQLKKMMGREYMGVVRSTFLINPEGKIEDLWLKVKVKGHATAVMNSLCSIK